MLIFVSAAVIYFWITKHFKLTGISLSVELDLAVALLSDSQITSGNLVYLLVKAVQVSCNTPDPLVILIYEHLAAFQLENHCHLGFKCVFKFGSFLHIHRGLLIDLPVLLRGSLMFSFKHLTSPAEALDFRNEIVYFLRMRIIRLVIFPKTDDIVGCDMLGVGKRGLLSYFAR